MEASSFQILKIINKLKRSKKSSEYNTIELMDLVQKKGKSERVTQPQLLSFTHNIVIPKTPLIFSKATNDKFPTYA